MIEEWEEAPFADVIDFQEGPGILAKDFRASGIPLVRLAGLENGARLLDGCNYLDPEMVRKKWAHFRLRTGDTLLSTSASLGRVAVVDAESEGSIAYTGIIRMRPRDARLDPHFIPYLLLGRHFTSQATVAGGGSVLTHFGPTHLRDMTVEFPPIEKQRAIARVLRSIDDKVALNRRMAQVVETAARAIFRSWLVDCEPVLAKSEGSAYGLDEGLLDLFPSEYAADGESIVPAGWSVAGLDEIANFRNGLAMQKWRPNGTDEWLPVVKIAELRQGEADGSERASLNIPAEVIIDTGDVIFSWSGTLMVKIWTGGKAGLNQHLFKVTSDRFPKWFYYFWTLEHLMQFQATADDKKTTMGHIRRHHLADAKVLIPPPSIVAAATPLVGAMLDSAVACQLQVRILQRLRSCLLGGLFSDEGAGAGTLDAVQAAVL